VITLRNVWFRYVGSRKWVVKDVTVMFRRGEAVVIKGANGAGKTTLMKIASLLYRPSKGSVLFDGADVWMDNLAGKLRGRVVYVHDRPIMLSGTVYDNLAYGLLIRGHSRDHIEEAVSNVAELLGIKSLLRERARNLSMGQKQLVAIGRALVLEPDFMFIDEPFTNLDSEKKDRVVYILNDYKLRGKGVVITSHTYEALGELKVDRTIHIVDGTIIPKE